MVAKKVQENAVAKTKNTKARQNFKQLYWKQISKKVQIARFVKTC